jgi:hypothetical protein
MFTRFYDDPNRVMKKLQESTDQGLYYLNQPGNGDRPPFMDDPQILLQKWGANLYNDRVQVESDLMGIRNKLSRNQTSLVIPANPIAYPTYTKEITSQPRATNPAWNARDLQQAVWTPLYLNPQENVEIPFRANISTRILEKNKF